MTEMTQAQAAAKWLNKECACKWVYDPKRGWRNENWNGPEGSHKNHEGVLLYARDWGWIEAEGE